MFGYSTRWNMRTRLNGIVCKTCSCEKKNYATKKHWMYAYIFIYLVHTNLLLLLRIYFRLNSVFYSFGFEMTFRAQRNQIDSLVATVLMCRNRITAFMMNKMLYMCKELLFVDDIVCCCFILLFHLISVFHFIVASSKSGTGKKHSILNIHCVPKSIVMLFAVCRLCA